MKEGKLESKSVKGNLKRIQGVLYVKHAMDKV